MTHSEKIGLGTVQFGMSYGISNKEGKTSQTEVSAILGLARVNGIDVLDAASAYGDAEKVLGENDLKDFKIVSKFLPPSPGGKINEQFSKSRKDLKISRLYAYLAHRPMELLDSPHHWDELKDLKEEGLVKKIGFSLNDPDELDLLLQAGFLPDLVQVPYNYFDRRFEKSLIQLKDSGCEVHTRSAFLQGLFFMKAGELDDFFDEVKPLLFELQQLGPLPGKLLKFVIEKPFIDKVIIGIENREQLSQNLKEVANASDLPELNKRISGKILKPSEWPKK